MPFPVTDPHTGTRPRNPCDAIESEATSGEELTSNVISSKVKASDKMASNGIQVGAKTNISNLLEVDQQYLVPNCSGQGCPTSAVGIVGDTNEKDPSVGLSNERRDSEVSRQKKNEIAILRVSNECLKQEGAGQEIDSVVSDFRAGEGKVKPSSELQSREGTERSKEGAALDSPILKDSRHGKENGRSNESKDTQFHLQEKANTFLSNRESAEHEVAELEEAAHIAISGHLDDKGKSLLGSLCKNNVTVSDSGMIGSLSQEQDECEETTREKEVALLDSSVDKKTAGLAHERKGCKDIIDETACSNTDMQSTEDSNGDERQDQSCTFQRNESIVSGGRSTSSNERQGRETGLSRSVRCAHRKASPERNEKKSTASAGDFYQRAMQKVAEREKRRMEVAESELPGFQPVLIAKDMRTRRNTGGEVTVWERLYDRAKERLDTNTGTESGTGIRTCNRTPSMPTRTKEVTPGSSGRRGKPRVVPGSERKKAEGDDQLRCMADKKVGVPCKRTPARSVPAWERMYAEGKDRLRCMARTDKEEVVACKKRYEEDELRKCTFQPETSVRRTQTLRSSFLKEGRMADFPADQTPDHTVSTVATEWSTPRRTPNESEDAAAAAEEALLASIRPHSVCSPLAASSPLVRAKRKGSVRCDEVTSDDLNDFVSNSEVASDDINELVSDSGVTEDNFIDFVSDSTQDALVSANDSANDFAEGSATSATVPGQGNNGDNAASSAGGAGRVRQFNPELAGIVADAAEVLSYEEKFAVEFEHCWLS